MKRLRWKTYFFFNPSETLSEQGRNFLKFKSQRTPPNHKLLEPFENDLFKLIKKIRFRKRDDHFQDRLKKDIRDLKNSKTIWVRADKSKNIYKIRPDEYQNLLLNKISNSYRLDYNNTLSKINEDTAKFANKFNISDRIGKMAKKSAYILFKDHKPNFLDKKQIRLINPSKTELGIISKNIITHITSNILKNSNYNLWKNSLNTIDWFKQIRHKSKATFIQFDIIDFYPSISKDLVIKSINHAKNFIEITDEQIEIILNCRRSIITNKNVTWIKNYIDNFDVSMGAYDSAQVADLVGIYILDTLSRIVDIKQIGLYRDDGLIYIPDSNGPKTSRIQKKIIRAFKLLGLKIEITSNLKIVNFLDVTLDISNNKFKPFHKENQTPTYINVNSNHPRSIIKQIPKSVNTRINRLSSDKKIFSENIKMYNEALENSGHKQGLEYLNNNETNIEYKNHNNNRNTYHYIRPHNNNNNDNRHRTASNEKNREDRSKDINNEKSTVNNNNRSNEEKKTKNRKRNVLWFNPPFCK